MSHFVCVANLDGRPLVEDDVRRLLDPIADLAVDGQSVVCGASVGLGVAHFWTTPEAVHEAMPLQRGDLTIAFDGRLDNRAEIRQLTGGGSPQDGDGAHVLAAYVRWGDELCERLVGDFAFVIWDGRRQQLTCAVDHLGGRSLRFFCDGRTFLASTVFPPILAHPAVTPAPNEGVVAEWLVGVQATESETLFEAVRQLRGAEQLSLPLRPGALPRIRRYWSLADEVGRPLRSAREAEEEMRHWLTEAVASRMRVHGRLGVELSGGWDSSTVAAIADHLQRSGRAGDFELLAQTYPGTPSDESRFIDAMECRLGRPVTRQPSPALQVEPYRGELRAQQHPFPRWPTRTGSQRVLLTGEGGNETLGDFSDGPGELLDALRRGRVDVPGRERQTVRGLLRESAVLFYRPLVPLPLRVRRTSLGHPWIRPELAERVHLVERLVAGEQLARRGSWRQRHLQRLHHTFGQGLLKALQNDQSVGRHPEMRHPCLDLRLLRSAMGWPQRVVGSYRTDPRRLQDGVFGPMLPDEVRRRRHGVAFDSVLAGDLRRLRAGREHAPRLAERGWVDGAVLADLPAGHADQFAQFLVYTCELWIEILKP